MRVRMLSMVVCAALACAMLGCNATGDIARANALSPAAKAAWPGVREDANLGVVARQDAEFMARQGGTAVGPGVAESRLERIRQFDEAVKRLGSRPTTASPAPPPGG